MMDGLVFLQGRGLPSGWIIDIWNCHGVLKPSDFAGYGNMDDNILKLAKEQTGEEHEWFKCGYYTIPASIDFLNVIRKAGLEEEYRKRIEKVLDWIIYDRNNGAINMSGFYMITDYEFEAIRKVAVRIYNKAIKIIEGEKDYGFLLRRLIK